MPETLTGQIERVTYHNAESGFAVLRVKVRGQRDLVTVVGNLTTVTAGEQLEATGQWRVDQQHGSQFQANDLKTSHPASAEGIDSTGAAAVDASTIFTLVSASRPFNPWRTTSWSSSPAPGGACRESMCQPCWTTPPPRIAQSSPPI